MHGVPHVLNSEAVADLDGYVANPRGGNAYPVELTPLPSESRKWRKAIARQTEPSHSDHLSNLDKRLCRTPCRGSRRSRGSGASFQRALQTDGLHMSGSGGFGLPLPCRVSGRV